jgi:hypothetical protein
MPGRQTKEEPLPAGPVPVSKAVKADRNRPKKLHVTRAAPSSRHVRGEKRKEVLVRGVSIPAGLLRLAHGFKVLDRYGRWTLATKRGEVIAVFLTEEAVDSWWQAFQSSQGRAPAPLDYGRRDSTGRIRRKAPGRVNRPTTKTTLKEERYRRRVQRNSGQVDYLKPWSAEYGMPECDLE